MTLDLDNLRRLVSEWAGVFDFGTDDDDVDILTFRPRVCIEERCECVSPCTANVADYDMAHESIATMMNALPALLADHARLAAEAADARSYAQLVARERDKAIDMHDAARAALTTERVAHHTTSDAAVAYMREIDTLREHQRAANQREDDMRAELLAERDAHHATCDALAREQAEVARLREALEVQHMASANRIAGAGGCCGGCDAAWLTAEVARLRGLVERACDGWQLVAHPHRERSWSLESDRIAAIRKEAAGE